MADRITSSQFPIDYPPFDEGNYQGARHLWGAIRSKTWVNTSTFCLQTLTQAATTAASAWHLA